MNIKSILGLAAMAITVIACQSNSYNIQGEAKGFADGDTLFLTTDLVQGTPSQIIVVKDGKFQLNGQSDSTFFCLIYKKNRPDVNVSFFIEPGNIHLEIGQDPSSGRVSGTTVNNQLQLMSDSTAILGRKMQELAEKAYGTDASEAQQAEMNSQMQQLDNRIMQIILRATEQNIDNELGYFILTNYQGDDIFDNQKRRELIEKMPPHYRQRPLIRQMEQMLKAASATEKGNQIPESKLPAPDGQEISLTEEVRKNKLTVIDFWASWCSPCMRTMPQMKRLYEQYHQQGFGIVGISLDQDREAWVNAIKEHSLSWIHMSDLKGWNNTVAKAFQITAIPHMVLVDQNGTILERGLHNEELEQFISNYMKQ